MRLLNHKRVLNCLGWLLTAFVILNGCSPQWHIKKASKHKEKAIKKGAVFTPDTIRVNGDTIVTSFIKNDTVFVKETVTEYITLEGEVRYITRKDKRKEHRNEKKKLKEEKKENRRDFVLEKRKSRKSYWFVWLVIGLVLGLIIPRVLKKIV